MERQTRISVITGTDDKEYSRHELLKRVDGVDKLEIVWYNTHGAEVKDSTEFLILESVFTNDCAHVAPIINKLTKNIREVKNADRLENNAAELGAS